MKISSSPKNCFILVKLSSCNDICTQIPETIYSFIVCDIRLNWVVSVLEEPECRGTMELKKSGINWNEVEYDKKNSVFLNARIVIGKLTTLF
jgi:hypothetical protein